MTAQGNQQALWRNHSFTLFWVGQTLSQIGSGTSSIAFPLLILYVSRSPAQVGLISGLASVPYIFLSLPAGAIVDRWDRRRVMIACDTVRTINALTIPLALSNGDLSLVQLYIVAGIEAGMSAFFDIASSASLPALVSREQVGEATSRNQLSVSVGMLTSPSLGGVLYQSVGRAVPFISDSASYAISALTLLFIRKQFQATRQSPPINFLTQVQEGFSWLRREPFLRFLAALNGAAVILSGQTLIVILLAQRQGSGSAAIGAIFSVGAVGSIAGSLVATRLMRRYPFGMLVIACQWSLLLVWPLYMIASTPLTLAAVTAWRFATNSVYASVLPVYRLRSVPSELQGRVSSIFRVLSWTCRLLGVAGGGILLQVIGVGATLRILLAGSLVLCFAATYNGRLRRAQLPDPI